MSLGHALKVTAPLIMAGVKGDPIECVRAHVQVTDRNTLKVISCQHDTSWTPNRCVSCKRAMSAVALFIHAVAVALFSFVTVAIFSFLCCDHILIVAVALVLETDLYGHNHMIS